ncbi:hypothetical protein B0T24DRAFT_36732 [Lasiosphaeria ovina]|uniref:Uncharacterized protein n=1 Tax=Lasiosphaeria ovina TaxID=92902 RepID=A0AAE0TXI3_9PEZI|nr:hypothetical protein B0T24DRAFT_36732 [Lasiosphaeria ovina]
MAGLIPLMLASGNRTSYVSPQTPLSQQSNTTTTTMTQQMARSKHARRSSRTLSVSLAALPYTQSDWRRTISDIKRQHLTKMYRACWTRCNEILDSISDASQIEPVYRIYLHFYAATSIVESCARPPPSTSTSTFRTSLLQQARAHFDRAASLISAAEESVVRRVRPGSVMSSRGSSCHSPAGSISSRTWTSDTPMSSPTNSVYSFEDLSAKSQSSTNTSPVKRVKKVSFSLPHDKPFRALREPMVRPDSPTLGFDDEYFHLGAARQELPDLPRPKFEEVELPLQVVSDMGSGAYEDAFLTSRSLDCSVDRYCDTLGGLRAQLASHSASLDSLLSAKPDPTQSFRLSLALSARSRSATLTRSSFSGPADELIALDRKARIERLRQSGWQRKRFDARRYEELCETVMSELA